MAYHVEVTDTFGGEANYSWVNRQKLDLPDEATTRQIVRAAKAAMGWTGLRCNTVDMGDDITVRPARDACIVMFITWLDEGGPH